MKTTTNPSNSDDFAALYEKSFSGMDSYQPGQLVETQVISISKDFVFLELNGKSEGILPREELLNKEGELSIKVGDLIKVYFLQATNGELLFTTRLSGESAGPELLERAYQEKIPVEGLVEKEVKGGYQVKIGESRAFCPYSQMGAKRSETPAEFVGKHLIFKIQEYKEGGRNILVSNRAIHEETRQVNLEELKKTLREGLVVTGQIQSLQDFGAFVDLGGVQALLPISEISRARVEDVRSVLKVGQEIQATILKIDWANERISLSMKNLQEDPWDKVVEQFPEGSKHSGKVVRLAQFGAFVALGAGVDGLVHVSEFRADSKYSDRGELSVKVGQTLSVQVIAVDRANKRISLKPATTREEDETSAKYLGGSTDTETYNPFAALLKKK